MKLTTRTLAAPLTLAALVLASSGAAAQTTWYVDDDGPGDPFPGVSVPNNPTFSDPAEDGSAAHPFDDLYKAVDAAASGDTVLVRPSNVVGYYALSSSLDLGGKSIHLLAEAGPGATVLDGTGIAGLSGVVIDSGEGATCVVEGFSFQAFDRGSPSIGFGAALFVQASSPTIRGCVFRNNRASSGGALMIDGSGSLVEDCTFLDNVAEDDGGAVYVYGGTPTFSRCTFDGNVGGRASGMMARAIGSSVVTIRDCLFFGHYTTTGFAGALAKLDAGDLLVERTRFIANASQAQGGAVYVSGPATIRDSVFNSNGSSSHQGGGLWVTAGSYVDVYGSTFAGNGGGGAGEDAAITYLVLYNCIVWDSQDYELTTNVGTSHCDVMGGHPGAGNIDANPLFVDAWGPDGVRGTLDDDLTLSPGSPCIDAGDTNRVLAAYPLDLAGNPRAIDRPQTPDTGLALLHHSTDMGAYELQPLPTFGTPIVRRKLP